MISTGYMPLFGGDNLVRSPGGRSVRLKLDRRTGKNQRDAAILLYSAALLALCFLFPFLGPRPHGDRSTDRWW
jgi:hypothetical protein